MSEGRTLLAIAAGGAAGSLARWLVGLAAGGAAWATLLVNVTGAFALGLLVAWLEGDERHPLARPVLAVGLLGGWTTYSSFVLDARTLAEGGGPGPFGYLALTLVLGLAGALVGLLLGERRWGGDREPAARVAEDEL